MQLTGDMLETAKRIGRTGRRGRDVRDVFEDWINRVAGTAAKRAKLKKWTVRVGPPLLIVLVAAAWLIFGPMRQPNYKTGSLKKVFSYTLLSDEFNNLPVEKRMELIGQLVQRLRGMSSGDSVILAAFASGIAGEARKHIEENASRLAIDMWDKYARQYEDVKEEDRAAFFDATFLEFVHTMEAVSGEQNRKSDSEMLADIRKQTERDKEAFRTGKGAPPNAALAQMFHIMHDNVGGHATNDQKARGQLLMRDMMRHFRGEDSGPPK